MIKVSALDFGWMDNIDPAKKVLIIAEGLLMYFTREEVRKLTGRLAEKFTGGSMLLEMMTPFLVRISGRHDAVNHTGAVFKWGIESGKVMESYHDNIVFIEEYNYFDFYKSRWRWLRLPAVLPVFKNRMNNRIVHLEFKRTRRTS